MATIKISEMPSATTFEDDDYAMIVQSNNNKKITKANMLSDVGDKTNLTTTNKTNLVSAINEVNTKAPNYSNLITLCNWTTGTSEIVTLNDDITKYSRLVILISADNSDSSGNAFMAIINPLLLKQLFNGTGGKAYNMFYDIGDTANNIRITYIEDTKIRFWKSAQISSTLYIKVYGVI